MLIILFILYCPFIICQLRNLYLWEFWLAFWSSFQAGYPTVLSYIALSAVVATSSHIAGLPITAGRLQSASYAIMSLIGALCSLPWLYTTMGRVGGYAARVAEQLQTSRDLRTSREQETMPPTMGCSNGSEGRDGIQVDVPMIEVRNVSVITPAAEPSPPLERTWQGGRRIEASDTDKDLTAPVKSVPMLPLLADPEFNEGTSALGHDSVLPLSPGQLLRGVSFSVHYGSSLLLEGPSGSGKTSLIRVLAGLWRHNHGTIQYSKASVSSPLLKAAHPSTLPTSSTSPGLVTGLSGTQQVDAGSTQDSNEENAAPPVVVVPQRPYLVPEASIRQQLLLGTGAAPGNASLDDGIRCALLD